MEVRLYRDACHPEMLFEIRTRLEDQGIDIRLTETVADLLNAGMPMERALHCLWMATAAEPLHRMKPQ